ncbi:hypothetical protein WMY93_010936 [Mugilogobius chulae]|uniref:NIF3-like protein 1 n=1 Tax=Mugilogobius chulae TaxID=88201 RepID=A0AAW0PHP2_9GOBI
MHLTVERKSPSVNMSFGAACIFLRGGKNIERSLAEDEIDELREAFNEFDKDKDGLITCKDLGNLMRTMGYMPTEMELIELSQNINMNRLCRADGPKLLAETAGMIGMKELKDAFKEFDMDGDGEITTEELRSAMCKLMGEHMSRKEIDAIVKEADDNGDGTVDFEASFDPHTTFYYTKSPNTPSLLCPTAVIPVCPKCQFSNHKNKMELKEVVHILEQLAPLSLAESWDNVGLLVEPSIPRPIKTILLTNDLTDAVMEEAETLNCDLIISYHPPLFRPIKSLVQKDWKQRLAIRAVEARMAVFSPHTSWDSVKGGVNDWLIGGLGSGHVTVLSQALSSGPLTHRLEFTVRSNEELNAVMETLKACDSSTTLQHSSNRSENSGIHVSFTCSNSALPLFVQTLMGHTVLSQSLTISKLEKHPLPGHGQGRMSVLDQPITVATAVAKMKTHLSLSHLRLALGTGQTLESLVRTVAVCAGSGASVLNGIKADLYVTGEMSHHEVLDAVAKGTSVILSDHSNSERGFLVVFRERLAVRLPETMSVLLSQTDRDPCRGQTVTIDQTVLFYLHLRLGSLLRKTNREAAERKKHVIKSSRLSRVSRCKHQLQQEEAMPFCRI